MRNCTVVCVLVVFVVGASACWWTNDDPQPTDVTPVVRTLPSSTPTPTDTPRTVSDPTAASNIPFPTPTASPTRNPFLTPTATPAPTSPPTLTATSVPMSPDDDERAASFMENFKSISYEASFEMPNLFTESDSPVTANANGWMIVNGTSQMFARIEMTKPVVRSIEVLTRNSFDIYLKDLDESKWYFIPENSDTGPLEDVMSVSFLALAFSVPPMTEGLEQVQDGYVWKYEDPSLGSTTVTYDQTYVLKEFALADANGQEIIRASFFDLNKPHDILPHEKGELLPETYWESQ